MKNISRIFSAVMCSASLFAFDACGTVATTAGSNLTAYNPNTAYNNQWAAMTNPRSDSVSAKADFGNCNAIVLRCAQPKCANGGCGEMAVASGIVSGCVKSNDKCKQYGDDLVNYMTAQLVANSQAKINASNAEQIQAAQDAAQQAQMAAQQAAAQSAQQMAEMQSNMQQQMMQMQQQMAEQNAQSAQQIADALAASQQQQQQAISDMRSAAESAAQTQISTMAVTQQDEVAISRGVSEDVLAREKVSGQIITELESAKTALNEVKAAMNTSFEYAGCDNRGDNCSGPKRVKKWRELAVEFIDPYDTVVAKISDALDVAQVLGIDLSDIYMMLNDSCNQWGQYMCPGDGLITYDYYDGDNLQKGQKGAPMVCPEKQCENNSPEGKKCYETELKKCRPCTLLKLLPDKQEVYDMWVNTEGVSQNNQTIVACASSAMKTGLLARHAKRKSGSGTLDLEVLEEWIRHSEPSTMKQSDVTSNCPDSSKCKDCKENCYCCNATTDSDFLKKLNSKKIEAKDLCSNGYSDNYCERIKPEYGICDVHPWNAGKKVPLPGTKDIEETKEVIGKKITLVSQQMYKQYEYLSATLRRLNTQLSKTVLTAQLEKAGASSEKSGGGSGRSNDSAIYLPGAENCFNSSSPTTAYSCIQNNANLVKSNVKTNRKKAKDQLSQTFDSAALWGIDTCIKKEKDVCKDDPCSKGVANMNDAEVTKCANALSIGAARKISEERNQQQQYYRPY